MSGNSLITCGLVCAAIVIVPILVVGTQPARAGGTVSGTIVDAETGGPIWWCAIENSDGETVFLTDEFGRFSIRVADPPATFVFSHIAYEALTVELSEADVEDGELAFRLSRRVYVMPEVEVAAERVPFDPERSAAP